MVGKMRRQDLDGHGSVETGVFGFIHLSHASHTER
jgi:hypothetical protein